MKNKISIITATRNRAKLLKKLLKKINQQVDAYPFEMIVVDDFSTDGTDILLKKARKKYDWLKIIILDENNKSLAPKKSPATNNGTFFAPQTPTKALLGTFFAPQIHNKALTGPRKKPLGPGLAREIARKIASGTALLTIDDDVIIDDYLLKNAQKIVEKGDFYSENKAYSGICSRNITNIYGLYLNIRDPIQRGWLDGKVLFIPTELALYPAALVEKAGGFHHNYPFACEDMALSDSIVENGGQLAQSFKLKACHQAPKSLYSLLYAQFRYGQGHKRYWKNNKKKSFPSKTGNKEILRVKSNNKGDFYKKTEFLKILNKKHNNQVHFRHKNSPLIALIGYFQGISRIFRWNKKISDKANIPQEHALLYQIVFVFLEILFRGAYHLGIMLPELE